MKRQRWMASALVAGASALMLVFTAGPAAAANPAGPPVRDPERYNSTGTAWGYLVTNKAAIDTWLNDPNGDGNPADQGRAINVESRGGDNFTVIGVRNTGVFHRAPHGSLSWTSNETYDSLVSKINAYKVRLLDLERYTVNGATRFAATWVQNDGVAGKAWWWWLNATPAFIVEKLNSCSCRLIDLDPLGNGRYDVIMIPNTGVDALGWWWYIGITQSAVYQYLTDNSARPVAVEPDGFGRFAVLMVRDGIAGSVRFDQTWAQVTSGPPFGRYIHLKEYVTSDFQVRWISVYMRNG